MRWARAVGHVESLSQACVAMAGGPSAIFTLPVTELWAVGDILGPARDLEDVTVALSVDLPVEDVAWWTEPPGAQHWSNATRMSKNPILPWWRSARGPVWNHRIVRPALVWDINEGVREDTLAALRAGNGEAVRTEAPSAADYAGRLRDELAVSLRALRTCTEAYEDRRWRPGKLEPLADALWQASDGYLDVLDAVEGQR